MAVAMNGWSLSGFTTETIVAGGRATAVRAGDVAVILGYVARAFHAEVEPIVTFHGYRTVAVNAAVGGHPRSNHPAGCAIDLNGFRHPYRRHHGFTPLQVAAIRRILAYAGGVVRWGGDFPKALEDGMHFEVVGTAAQVRAVANRLRRDLAAKPVPTRPASPTPARPVPTPPVAAPHVPPAIVAALTKEEPMFRIRVAPETNGVRNAEGGNIYAVRFGPKGHALFEHIDKDVNEALERSGDCPLRRLPDGKGGERDYSQYERDRMHRAVVSLRDAWSS